MLRPIPFGITSYQSRALQWAAQRCVNWYPAVAPNPLVKTKTPIALLPRPGLVSTSSVGGDSVRGYHVMRGVLYAVIGSKFYEIAPNGGKIQRGTVPSGGNVVMDASDTELCITLDGPAYVYNGSTNAFTQITDPDFPGSASVSFLDQFFIHTVPNSAQFFSSDAGSATAFNSLDFATAEADGDDIVRGISDHRELWLFGQKSIEVWHASGTLDFPLRRRLESQIERGLIGVHAVTKFDNSLAFVGEDKIVYRMNGYTPQRISQDGIDRAIENASNPADIVATSYSQDGHTFLGLRSASGNFSFWYDAATQLWHERETTTDTGQRIWDVGLTANAYNKSWGGSQASAAMYEMSVTAYDDAGSAIRRESTSGPISNLPNRTTMNMLQFDFQMGVGLATGQGSDPLTMVTFSDDGGMTWENEIFETLGAIGDGRAMCRLWQLGQFTNRIVRVAVSDPVQAVLMGVYGDLVIDGT